MNVAIGVWVLLAGGWVLPSDDQSSIPPRAGVLNVGEAPDSGGRLTRVVSLPEAQPVITQPLTVGRSRGTGQAMPWIGSERRGDSLSAFRPCDSCPPCRRKGLLATGYSPRRCGECGQPDDACRADPGIPRQPAAAWHWGVPANMFGRNGAGGGRSMGPPMTSFTQLESRNTGGGLGPMGTGFMQTPGARGKRRFPGFSKRRQSVLTRIFSSTITRAEPSTTTRRRLQPQLQQQQQQAATPADRHRRQRAAKPGRSAAPPAVVTEPAALADPAIQRQSAWHGTG